MGPEVVIVEAGVQESVLSTSLHVKTIPKRVQKGDASRLRSLRAYKSGRGHDLACRAEHQRGLGVGGWGGDLPGGRTEGVGAQRTGAPAAGSPIPILMRDPASGLVPGLTLPNPDLPPLGSSLEARIKPQPLGRSAVGAKWAGGFSLPWCGN